MAVTAGDVKTDLGSTNLGPSEIVDYIDDAEAWYNSELPDSASLDSAVKDLVIQKLAVVLIRRGPEPEVKSGSEGDGSVSFTTEQRAWDAATRIDPKGVLGESDNPAASLSAPDVKD